jgi:hypothetical protein
MGRLTRNTQFHETCCTRMPPSSGPVAGASAVGSTRIADAFTRSAGGKVRISIEVPTGVSSPPPMPWTNRKKTSSLKLVDTPHSTEAAVNSARAKSRTLRLPKRSPIHPEAGMKTASDTRNEIDT